MPGGESRHWHWKVKTLPSIFMPRKFSRITLELTGVRVERLQEISKSDAIAEGVTPPRNELYPHTNRGDKCLRSYEKLWDSLNAKRGFGWDKNPYVWVLAFKRDNP